jgi:Zn-dependent M28 family amino/carboxypeptidase
VQVNDNPYTFATRYSRAEIPIKKATKFVQEHFLGLGLTAFFSTFFIDSETVELRNVIANQPGVTDPDCIVMLVGHLDNTSQIPHSLAPGADDNASGIAGVLVGADILSQFKFACTIRYAAFTGEEQGLLGSQDYASEVYAAGENVVAVVNLDMIAYNSDIYEIIELHTRPGNSGDLAIANLFKNVVQAYDINLTPHIEQDALSFSDHSSFWDYGYSAILGIEDFDDFTPYYHTTGDRLSTLDSVYMADFIRAAVGTVAHLAVPVQFEDMYLPMIFK